MIIEMKVPSPGESITEVQIARWLVADGEYVEKDQELCEIDSDKATLTLNAEENGAVKILVQEGETVSVGNVACTIDTTAKGITNRTVKKDSAKKEPIKTETKPVSAKASSNGSSYTKGVPSVAAQKIMAEKALKPEQIIATGKGGRITKGDVLQTLSRKVASGMSASGGFDGSRNERREKMSTLRKKLSQRLVAVKNATAMLTTFNEVDMSAIINLRKQYKNTFKEIHGVGLGFMSFFTKAATEALKSFPSVNAMIDGDEIVYHDYADIGIAVSAPKGLMVPVMRNAESMTLARIEAAIIELATKARDGKITLEEMTGGTFTITNGGIFGSMLSTPILNPPQSAILGMHNVVERPVVVNGKIEVRPVMYVALSYDHRVIDGKESVGFLVKVKQMLEEPVKMLFAGEDPVKYLLDL